MEGKNVKEWSVELHISEDETNTLVRAELVGGGGKKVVGYGQARRNPIDRPVPEIGDELAVSRALADLADRLHIIAGQDIAQLSGPA